MSKISKTPAPAAAPAAAPAKGKTVSRIFKNDVEVSGAFSPIDREHLANLVTSKNPATAAAAAAAAHLMQNAVTKIAALPKAVTITVVTPANVRYSVTAPDLASRIKAVAEIAAAVKAVKTIHPDKSAAAPAAAGKIRRTTDWDVLK